MSEPNKPPIFLLKTRSSPNDSYEEYFSADDSPFHPTFIPVLEHRYNEPNLQKVKQLLLSDAFSRNPESQDGQTATTTTTHEQKYGGIIFTSQRAVEGFARIVVDEVGRTFLHSSVISPQHH